LVFCLSMVRAIMIVEMAGRPAEHVKDSLTKHIEILNNVKDAEVHSIKVSEPKEIENSNKMFTCFAEADFEIPSFARLSETMFDFMPSSVEVIEPAQVIMNMNEATDLLNNISGRMHRYDEIAKVAGVRLQQMAEREKELVARLEEKEKKNAKKKIVSKKKVKK
jgi:hypothetical protein